MYASKTLDIRPKQGEALDVAVDRYVNEFLTEKQMGGEFELIHTHFTISDAYKKVLVVICPPSRSSSCLPSGTGRRWSGKPSRLGPTWPRPSRPLTSASP